MKTKTLVFSLAAMVTGFGTVAYAQQQSVNLTNTQALLTSNTIVAQERNPEIRNSSGASEIALARHLRQRGAKMYGAYWCPYCHRQRELFGRQAFNQITYIECDPRGQNGRPDLCRRANVSGFPTWEINGQQYSGLQSLNELANISGYRGSRNFRNQ